METVVLRPLCPQGDKSRRINEVLTKSLQGVDYKLVENLEEFQNTDFTNKRIIFALSLGESGVNLTWYQILKSIRLNPHCFKGSIAGVIVDGKSELYTKDAARHLVFSSNASGCTFIGRPLVEATKDLQNYNILAENQQLSKQEAYEEQSRDLVQRLQAFSLHGKAKPKLLVLHAGNYAKSNSLVLWQMVEKQLTNIEIKEVSLRNGEIYDCIGCPYNMCLHYGEKNFCFYGGVVVEQVYPAMIECDGLMMVCANYNDALSANLAAFINRMTAPFRSNDFTGKMLFSIVVSGYSGGDLVAQQLISGINMNKSFVLPPNFALLETANDPGSILKVPDINEKAARFGESMNMYLTKGINEEESNAI